MPQGLRSPVHSQTLSCPIHSSGTTPALKFSLFLSLLRDHSNLGSSLVPSLPQGSLQPWDHPSPHQFFPKPVTTPQTSSPTSAMAHPTLALRPSHSPQSTGNPLQIQLPWDPPGPAQPFPEPRSPWRWDPDGIGLSAARPQAHVRIPWVMQALPAAPKHPRGLESGWECRQAESSREMCQRGACASPQI